MRPETARLAGRRVRLHLAEPAPPRVQGLAFRVEGDAAELVHAMSPAAIGYVARQLAAGREPNIGGAIYGHFEFGGVTLGLLVDPDEIGGVVDEP